MHVYIEYMYIAVYLRYHVSLLVNINIFYMTPQRATWKNSYYMLNVLPSLNKVLLLLSVARSEDAPFLNLDILSMWLYHFVSK